MFVMCAHKAICLNPGMLEFSSVLILTYLCYAVQSVEFSFCLKRHSTEFFSFTSKVPKEYIQCFLFLCLSIPPQFYLIF